MPPTPMEPRKASPAKDCPSGFMSEERVDDDIVKEEEAFFGAVRPDEPLIEYAPVQSTDQVLLISPTAFGYNPEAAKDNRFMHAVDEGELETVCLLYTSPSPRDQRGSRMPSSA